LQLLIEAGGWIPWPSNLKIGRIEDG